MIRDFTISLIIGTVYLGLMSAATQTPPTFLQMIMCPVVAALVALAFKIDREYFQKSV